PVPAAGGRARLRSLPLEAVAREAVITAPGAVIAYVTDIRRSAANDRRVLELARGADHFFCEAAFLERDADHAARKHHLTARQAGELARLAGARKLTVFHFSPKYEDEEEAVRAEAEAAHGSPLG
ncbi:MAG TPA: ribonuclease Z, partial [bacterium]